MSQFELYWISGSPYSWRAQLVLALHQVDYVSHCLSLSQKEQRQPAYLALNPRGKVPLLKDGDYLIRESIAILAYLGAKFPHWQLFGSSPEETGRIWQQLFDQETYLAGPLLQFALPIFRGKLPEEQVTVLKAMRRLKRELAQLDDRLAQQPWLASPQLSAADIAAYPMLQVAKRAASREAALELDLELLPLAARYPNLAQWLERIAALPGAAATYPPHW